MRVGVGKHSLYFKFILSAFSRELIFYVNKNLNTEKNKHVK